MGVGVFLWARYLYPCTHVQGTPESLVFIQGLFETTVEKLLHVYGDAIQLCSVQSVLKFYFVRECQQICLIQG